MCKKRLRFQIFFGFCEVFIGLIKVHTKISPNLFIAKLHKELPPLSQNFFNFLPTSRKVRLSSMIGHPPFLLLLEGKESRELNINYLDSLALL